MAPFLTLHEEDKDLGRKVGNRSAVAYFGKGCKYTGNEFAKTMDGKYMKEASGPADEWNGFKWNTPTVCGENAALSMIVPGTAEELFQYFGNAKTQPGWNSMCSEVLSIDPKGEGKMQSGEGITIGMCPNFPSLPTWFGRACQYHYYYTHARKIAGKGVAGKEGEKEAYWWRCISYSPAVGIHSADCLYITQLDERTCELRYVVGLFSSTAFFALLFPIPIITWGLLYGTRVSWADLENACHNLWNENHPQEVNPVSKKYAQVPMGTTMVACNRLFFMLPVHYIYYKVITYVWGLIVSVAPFLSGHGCCVLGLLALVLAALIVRKVLGARASFYEEFPEGTKQYPKWEGDKEGNCPGGSLYAKLFGASPSGVAEKKKGKKA